MRGKPVEVINGPVTGLPIPANAEIVLEGFVEPGNERVEGPFGEWTGYYASDAAAGAGARHQGGLLIATIRSCSAACRQRPPDEICRYRAVVRSGLLRENITKAGVPGVTAAWAHEVGNARLLLAVADQPALSRPRQAGRPYRRHVPRRRLLRALRDRGRRRHRRVESRGADLGAAHALRTPPPRSTSSATPGRRRSIRASSLSARRSATSPTAGRSSTPAGPGTGATSSRR